jgi:hypothetical protein
MRTVSLIIVVVTLALGSMLSLVMGTEDHVMVTPNDLTWAEVPSLPPGAKVAVIEGPMDQATPFTIRLKLPADYKIPPHWHPAIEHVTVLSGTFHLGMGDKLEPTRTKALPASPRRCIPPARRAVEMSVGLGHAQATG